MGLLGAGTNNARLAAMLRQVLNQKMKYLYVNLEQLFKSKFSISNNNINCSSLSTMPKIPTTYLWFVSRKVWFIWAKEH